MTRAEVVEAVVGQLRSARRPTSFTFEDLAERAEVDAGLLSLPSVRSLIRARVRNAGKYALLVAGGHFNVDDVEAQIRDATAVLTGRSTALDAQDAKAIIKRSSAVGKPAAGFRALGFDGTKDDGLCLRELMVKQRVVRGLLAAATSSVRALAASRWINPENARLIETGIGGSALILARDLGYFTWPDAERRERRPSSSPSEFLAAKRERNRLCQEALDLARGRGFAGPSSGPGAWTAIGDWCLDHGIAYPRSNNGISRAS